MEVGTRTDKENGFIGIGQIHPSQSHPRESGDR
jgi:hypothetical protein